MNRYRIDNGDISAFEAKGRGFGPRQPHQELNLSKHSHRFRLLSHRVLCSDSFSSLAGDAGYQLCPAFTHLWCA
jgi:hypothetical protein